MIPLIKSTFYQEEITKERLVNFILTAKKLSFGPECEKFEKKFAAWQRRKHCVFLNSGSSANLAIIQALLNTKKLKRGDRVGFSSLTWSTNVMPLIELGLEAVPVDIELDTLNVSSKTLMHVLDKIPMKAMFLTNLLGFCDDIDMIKNMCMERDILLLEDNCESLGTIYQGEKLGNFGLASTFSFYVGHHMSTIEGGAVCTNDEELATMLRIVRAHGWDRNLSLKRQMRIRNRFRINSPFYSRYTFYDLGYNLRPTEINGFIGNVQLGFLNEVIKKRNNNFLELAERIYKRTDIYFPMRHSHIDFLSSFAIPIICKSKATRDSLVRKCKDRVEIRPIVGGDITMQPFYGKYMKHIKKLVKERNSALVHKQGLYFGNNPELTEKEIDEMIHIFTNV